MARYQPSWSRFRRLTLAVLMPLLGACSESGGDPCERDGHAGFESRAPFDARARVRRVDCGFRSGVEGLALAPGGSLWLRRIEYKDRGDDTFFHPPAKLLTHVGPGGEFLGEQSLPDFVQAHVVHPSGELTVVGWERSEDGKILPMRRLRPDGSLLSEKTLSIPVPPEGRMYYSGTPSLQPERIEVPEENRALGILDVRAHGEEVFLLVAMDGMRLVRLGGDLEVRWVSPVAPSVGLTQANSEQMRALGLPFLGWKLDVDEAGRATVAIPFPRFHQGPYAENFPQSPVGPEGRAILVSRFEPTGQLVAARKVPAEHADELVGLVASGETFVLGARAATPVEQPDNRTEADVFFASDRWGAPEDALVTRTHSIDMDDAPVAMLPCGTGRYCFAGHTSYLDTDLQRTHEPGEGFLLVVDARGEQQDLLRLQGQRDTEVRHAVTGPGGSVVFEFATNQPANIARVGDRFKNNESWLGVFDVP
ncbi:hypothetical protein HPC49_45365 [Pyxidicoccus fallax]|uniref:Lipoprotein n=1 Tax=Pyxidicoccus fallax TaxID=394095 RepID=A0A848LU60_9BACT|nr:hypothetical protein [Pyxidicoccus fallax]NMO21023.1 hypothetical protein [Pyxidicoccus fallax]NPC85411.1 hypothetical protein [Pyxidicoccus fallax]